MKRWMLRNGHIQISEFALQTALPANQIPAVLIPYLFGVGTADCCGSWLEVAQLIATGGIVNQERESGMIWPLPLPLSQSWSSSSESGEASSSARSSWSRTLIAS